MNHSYPTDIQQRIEAQLAAGTFDTEEEVLREAMEALERRQRGLSQLRTMVAAAEADVSANKTGPFDRDDIKSAVRRRLFERGIRD